MTVSLAQALIFHRENNFIKAEEYYLALINSDTIKPDTIKPDINKQDIHYLLGLLYSQNKCHLKAIHHLEQALSKYRSNAEIHHALALCYQKTCNLKPAEQLINIALSLDPKNKYYCNRRSKILLSAKKIQQSIDNSLSCISLHSEFTPAYLSYIEASNTLNRPDNSLRIIKRAYKENPTDPEIVFTLALAYHNVGNDKKAAPIFMLLYENNYKEFECLNNLANIEREYGEIKKAEEIYLLAKKSQPKNPVILWNLSLLSLTKSDFLNGWKNYDQRLHLKRKSDFKNKSLMNTIERINQWNGEDLTHKNMLIISEQGLGDEILFSSSFNFIENQAKKVILLCSGKLKQTFEYSFPGILCIDKDKAETHQYDIAQCHYKINSGSIFQYTGKKTIIYPYLKSDKSQNKPQKHRQNKLKIGFSWKGGEKYPDIKKRSIQLKKWIPFIHAISPISDLYCLQHNTHCDEKKLLDHYFHNIHYLSSSNNITQLVNTISDINIVISVTNTNVHIAGALGIKTLCLTPHNPDWPWGLKGEACDWYDSVQIIRQDNKSWNGIFNRILPIIKKEAEKKPKL